MREIDFLREREYRHKEKIKKLKDQNKDLRAAETNYAADSEPESGDEADSLQQPPEVAIDEAEAADKLDVLKKENEQLRKENKHLRSANTQVMV